MPAADDQHVGEVVRQLRGSKPTRYRGEGEGEHGGREHRICRPEPDEGQRFWPGSSGICADVTGLRPAAAGGRGRAGAPGGLRARVLL